MISVGERVQFIGYPSYLRGKKGVVSKCGEEWTDLHVITLDDGGTIVTESHHVEVISNDTDTRSR